MLPRTGRLDSIWYHAGMPIPTCLILRTAGTNCDAETAHAFALAGTRVELLHVNRLLERPAAMADFQLLAIPGGFSYGDDIAAGRIFASQIKSKLADAFAAFVDAGKPIIGICNGFQVLLKTGLLPGPLGGGGGGDLAQTCTLAANASGRFVDRWVTLRPRGGRCVWTDGLSDPIELPVAHGEGRFVCGSDPLRRALWDEGRVALTYADGDNFNGSEDAIAGVCDATGLVFGLMPHPERHVTPLQHPAWTRLAHLPDEGAGVALFRNAVRRVVEA